jgi:hypothetical protein
MSFSSFNRGERVRIIAPQRTKALAVGDKGYIIRNSSFGHYDEVAVMFDKEFREGLNFVAGENSDEEIIRRGLVYAGEHVQNRSAWVRVEDLELCSDHEIQWIE